MRTCDVCGDAMTEGYLIGGGQGYYCSDNCLHTEISPEEFEDLFADGEGDSYWTEWEEDEDDDIDESNDSPFTIHVGWQRHEHPDDMVMTDEYEFNNATEMNIFFCGANEATGEIDGWGYTIFNEPRIWNGQEWCEIDLAIPDATDEVTGDTLTNA
jgi:hypothetical protein